MSDEPPRRQAADDDPLVARSRAALERGGYWRAALEGRAGPRLDALLSGQILTSEWRLPRVPADDPSLAILDGKGYHFAVIALDTSAGTEPAAASGTSPVRIAPGIPADWSALEVGDQLEELYLGMATLSEYVSSPPDGQ